MKRLARAIIVSLCAAGGFGLSAAAQSDGDAVVTDGPYQLTIGTSDNIHFGFVDTRGTNEPSLGSLNDNQFDDGLDEGSVDDAILALKVESLANGSINRAIFSFRGADDFGADYRAVITTASGAILLDWDETYRAYKEVGTGPANSLAQIFKTAAASAAEGEEATITVSLSLVEIN